MSHSDSAPGPHLTGFTVDGYKAFGQPTSLALGRLTFLLGRNNAGKSALCLAPPFITHPLIPDAPAPFPTSSQGIDFGSLPSVCFRRQPTGLTTTLELEGVPGIERITIGATSVPEQGNTQIVTVLDIERSGGSHQQQQNLPWPKARDILRSIPGLAEIPRSIDVLRGVRSPGPRSHPYLGHVPAHVGPNGEHAPMILAAAGEDGLHTINEWLTKRLEIRLSVDERRDEFEILASGLAGEPVNIVDSGAGIAHILPLVVAILLTERRPSLLCIEQPELHLHPRAHVDIADLLLDVLARRPATRLLVETHSDVVVLRIRRAIAEGRLPAGDVRIYFVEGTSDGSVAREIALNDRGTPSWWPKGVFAEPQREYFAIRRALAGRDEHDHERPVR